MTDAHSRSIQKPRSKGVRWTSFVEDGEGWTTVAIDRATREWSIAQRPRQLDAAQAAHGRLYV